MGRRVALKDFGMWRVCVYVTHREGGGEGTMRATGGREPGIPSLAEAEDRGNFPATYSCIRGKEKLLPIPHCSLDQRRLSGKPQDIAFPPDDQGGSSLEEGADWLLAATDRSLNRERMDTSLPPDYPRGSTICTVTRLLKIMILLQTLMC